MTSNKGAYRNNERFAGADGRAKDSLNTREAGIGDALRSVYGDALSEGIPPEMMALLGKLD